MTDGYHQTRFAPDARRTAVWQALWRYHFRHQIAPGDAVLDLGSGRGDFINAVVARRRIAVDTWPGLAQSVRGDVEAIVGSVTDLGAIDDESIDFAFASNLFEHLSKDDLAETLRQVRRKLAARGRLVLLQPNYRYAYKEYFDDYTHQTIFSHISLADFLSAQGWDVVDVKPRFMPLTINSRLPVSSMLIRLYLALPIKPLGKQMLVTARPRRS